MAQYDGAIRIATKITTKDAEESLASLEWQIKKSAKYMDELRSKMDALKDQKIPSKDYKDLQEELASAEKELSGLIAEQERYNELGVSSGGAWDALNEKVASASDKVDLIKEKMQALTDAGKDFVSGKDTEQYTAMVRQLQYEEEAIAKAAQHYNKLFGKTKEGYKQLGDAAKKSFNSVGNVLKKANSHVNSFGKRLKEIAHKILPTFHKETKRTNTVLGQFSTRLKSLLSGMFIFNAISSYIRKMFSGVNEGFENFYNQNAAFKSSVDSMRTSLLQLKNTFAAAFALIVSVAIPYLEKLISYITKAINSVGQLIAALLGKKTYTRAIRVNVENLEDTSDALEEVKEEAKEAEKALDGYLSPLDEINKYSEDKEIKVDIDTPKKPDASDIGDNIVDMFEEVPIDSYFLDLADKVKDIFSQLFAPLKEAWNREGKFVMDSWKYALKEVGDLLKSIGSDFLEVWQQEKTIKIFEDLLHIIGDIGLVVGNLAHNFRLAWEENEAGKRILEGIRDIIGVIVANICHAADATVEWSKNLDFSPLLTAIKNWIESLVPVFDNLSGIITDFYEKVLLPLGKWTLEKGLPELLQVFIDFNNKVDWEALRERLAQLWEHLEPFAETIGEGLIIFIERCANALADFINSPAFDNFLTMIENWMDSVSPEDVADALEAIAKAIVSLKAALAGFTAISKAILVFEKALGVFEKIKTAAGGIKKGFVTIAEGIKSLFGGLTGLPGAGNAANALGIFTSFNPGMIGELGMKLGDLLTGSFLDPREWEGWIGDLSNNIYSWVNISIDEGVKRLKEFIVTTFSLNNTMSWFNEAYENFKKGGLHILEGILDGFIGAVILIPEAVVNFFEALWNEICNIFGIHSPADAMLPIGENILRGIIEGFQGAITEFTEAVSTWWEESVSPWFTSEKWSELYENIKQALVDKWNEIVKWWSGTAIVGWWEEHVSPWFTVEKWMELFENIKTSLKEVWDNTVGQWVSDISAWWDEHVAPWFTVEKWEEILNNVPEAFSNGFTKVVDTVKEKIQGVIDWVVEKVDWLKEKVESVKETFNGFKSRVSGFFSGGTFESGTYSTIPHSVLRSPAFASLSTTPIPALARGAVIPANREFLAVLGDQKHGTNVEAPLDTIKKALREEAISLGLTSSANSSQTVIAKLYLDGKQITEAVIKDGKVRQMSTGNNPFALGTT